MTLTASCLRVCHSEDQPCWAVIAAFKINPLSGGAWGRLRNCSLPASTLLLSQGWAPHQLLRMESLGLRPPPEWHATTGAGNTALVGMAELLWVKNRVRGNLNFTASFLSLCRRWGEMGHHSVLTVFYRPLRLKHARVDLGSPLQHDVNLFVLHSFITTAGIVLGPCRHIWLVPGSRGESICSGPLAQEERMSFGMKVLQNDEEDVSSRRWCLGDLIVSISKCVPYSYPHVPLAAQQNWDDLELERTWLENGTFSCM